MDARKKRILEIIDRPHREIAQIIYAEGFRATFRDGREYGREHNLYPLIWHYKRSYLKKLVAA